MNQTMFPGIPIAAEDWRWSYKQLGTERAWQVSKVQTRKGLKRFRWHLDNASGRGGVWDASFMYRSSMNPGVEVGIEESGLAVSEDKSRLEA